MKRELLRIVGGSKTVHGMELLHDVFLDLYERETILIAGASVLETNCLADLLTGKEHFTSGHIYYEGELDNRIGNTRILRRQIAEVPQDGGMVENASLTDNFFVYSKTLKQPFFVEDKKNKTVLREIFERFWVDIDPDASAASLSFLQRYQFQLLKLYFCGKRIIFLDKRQTRLSGEDFRDLCGLMDRLKQHGMTFLILDYVVESFDSIDTLVVVREASTVLHEDVSLLSEKQRRAIMETETRAKRTERPQDTRNVVLRLDRVYTEWLNGVDFTLHKGEIVAICYQSYETGHALYQLLTGREKPWYGTLQIKGRTSMHTDPARRVREGVANIEEFATTDYLFENFTALQNYCFPKGLNFKRIWSSRSYQRYLKSELIRFSGRELANEFPLDLQPEESLRIRYRAQLLARPDVLICKNPFSSVDQAMREEVLQLLTEIAQQGTAIVLFSRLDSTRSIKRFTRYELDRSGTLEWFDEVEEPVRTAEYFW